MGSFFSTGLENSVVFLPVCLSLDLNSPLFQLVVDEVVPKGFRLCGLIVRLAYAGCYGFILLYLLCPAFFAWGCWQFHLIGAFV